MNQAVQNHDTIIIGAGAVGLTLALALAQGGLKVALVDRRPIPTAVPEPLSRDARVFAINAAAQRIFTRLGVWEAMTQARMAPYEAMVVWDAQGQGEIHFEAQAVGEWVLGHIIEDQVIRGALGQGVAQAGVTCLCSAELQTLYKSKQHVGVQLSQGLRLQAPLIVGADGAHSWVRQHMGCRVSRHDYDQMALVATLEAQRLHEATAWQRFLPTGPLALLPLAKPHQVSLVWSTDTQSAQRLKGLAPEAFGQAVSEASQHRLGTLALQGVCHSFPLVARHTQSYVATRMALVGDAAHTLHPLAGQGMNLGLLDAAYLAAEVLAQFQAGRDVGDAHCLRRYARRRRGPNSLMINAMSAMNYFFAARQPMARRLRDLGMGAVSRSDTLKTFFMRHAMGLRGELPPLAQVV